MALPCCRCPPFKHDFKYITSYYYARLLRLSFSFYTKRIWIFLFLIKSSFLLPVTSEWDEVKQCFIKHTVMSDGFLWKCLYFSQSLLSLQNQEMLICWKSLLLSAHELQMFSKASGISSAHFHQHINQTWSCSSGNKTRHVKDKIIKR